MANFNLDNYIPVNDRLTLFYKEFPNGRVNTEIIQHDIATGLVIIKASVYREKDDAEPSATGHAYENQTQGYVNKTSYIENCETSAVGRALALLGYEITRGIASREEMAKVERLQPKQQSYAKPNGTSGTITEKQEKFLIDLCNQTNSLAGDVAKWASTGRTEKTEELTAEEAKKAIEKLKVKQGQSK